MTWTSSVGANEQQTSYRKYSETDICCFWPFLWNTLEYTSFILKVLSVFYIYIFSFLVVLCCSSSSLSLSHSLVLSLDKLFTFFLCCPLIFSSSSPSFSLCWPFLPAFSSWTVLTTRPPLSSRHPEAGSGSPRHPLCTSTTREWAICQPHHPWIHLLPPTPLPPWSRPSGRSCCVSLRNRQLYPATTAEALASGL